jgi:hypothetical protein
LDIKNRYTVRQPDIGAIIKRDASHACFEEKTDGAQKCEKIAGLDGMAHGWRSEGIVGAEVQKSEMGLTVKAAQRQLAPLAGDV